MTDSMAEADRLFNYPQGFVQVQGIHVLNRLARHGHRAAVTARLEAIVERHPGQPSTPAAVKAAEEGLTLLRRDGTPIDEPGARAA